MNNTNSSYLGAMVFNWKIIVNLFFITLINTTILGQQESLAVQRVKDFDLTGKGNARSWEKADWNIIIPRSEGETRMTKFKILYSDTGIYVLFDCEDEIITCTYEEDFANLWEEDVIEVFLWTDENYNFYFEYELSPHNYELPIMVPNVEGDFFGWRPWQYEGNRLCQHKTHIHKEGEKVTNWTAEMFIPYTLLKPLGNVPPSPGMKWRANFYRWDHDYGERRWEWQEVNRNFHAYKQFGTLIFE